MKKVLSAIISAVIVFSVAVVPSGAAGRYNYGDVNADGKVTSSDALMILQASTYIIELDDKTRVIADVTGDGKLNSADALQVLMYSVGIISSFDKSYENSLKAKYVDTVFSNKAYTADMVIPVDGFDTEFVITTDGEKYCVSMIMDIESMLKDIELDKETADQIKLLSALIGGKLEIRYFTNEDAQSYVIIPMLKSYAATDDDGITKTVFETIDMLMNQEYFFKTITSVKKDSINYTCETYESDSDFEIKYLFNGASLKYIEIHDDENGDTVYKINKLTSFADKSLLQIPSGFKEDPSLADMGD